VNAIAYERGPIGYPLLLDVASSTVSSVAEADFMRWRNTKRMTRLRKAEQDGMWGGVVKECGLVPSFMGVVGIISIDGYFQTPSTTTGVPLRRRIVQIPHRPYHLRLRLCINIVSFCIQ
jgi:hypothetical protein